MLGAGQGAGHGAASSQQALGEGSVDGGGVPSAVVVLHGRVRVESLRRLPPGKWPWV